MTKKQLLMILNVYQNYYNDFNNISEIDLHNIYKAIAFKDISENINEYLKYEQGHKVLSTMTRRNTNNK